MLCLEQGRPSSGMGVHEEVGVDVLDWKIGFKKILRKPRERDTSKLLDRTAR